MTKPKEKEQVLTVNEKTKTEEKIVDLMLENLSNNKGDDNDE